MDAPLINEETFRAIVAGTGSVIGSDFFSSCVRHLASALHVRYAFIAECENQKARTLAFWNGDDVGENFEYELAGTPCMNVQSGDVCHYGKELQSLFPLDTGLVDWRAESYLGVPMLDPSGHVIGHIAVLDDKPMERSPHAVELLTIFSARAAAELRRQRAEQELQAALRQVQTFETRNRTVLDVNNAIISKLTREELFQAISGSLQEVMGFDRIAIFLHDPQKDVLRLLLFESLVPSKHLSIGREIPTSGSPAGWVFQNQRALYRHDLEKERQFEMDNFLLSQGFRSFAIVPLIIRGKTIGTLNLVCQKIGQYSESDVEILQEVANQIALAIENMRAYEEIAALQAKLEAENIYLQEELKIEHNFDEIVGNSPVLLEVLRRVETVAPTDSTVLIIGETGCGKELIARAIHSRSARRNRPLVKVNCGAIPTGLVESELFGHMKGAFTGALERRVGRFELADGGTLFLDEVSELPLDTQVKLLRVLQEHEFEPLGSSRTLQVNVRIIAASNRDLEVAIRGGRFRADLYYRLNVVQIVTPPLRMRRRDIPLLVSFFVERFSRQFGKTFSGVSQESMDVLSSYEWPGNIRELQNVIERAVVLSTGPVLKLGRDLLPVSRGESASAESSGGEPKQPTEGGLSYASLEQVEKNHIMEVLNHSRWVIEGAQGAAKILDMHPNTLRSRMKKLGIERSSIESISPR